MEKVQISDENKKAMCKLALKELGQKVYEVCIYDVIPPAAVEEFIFQGRIRRLSRFLLTQYNLWILNVTRKIKPNVFITINGDWIYYSTIRKMKRYGVKTICWWVDDPEINPKWRERILIYDYFFTFFPQIDIYYLGKNLPNVYYLPLGCWKVLESRLSTTNFKRDICFVSKVYPNRLNIIRKILEKIKLMFLATIIFMKLYPK